MTRKLNTLSKDDKILDIRPTNPVFVSRYRQAMRAGDQFPPLLIDQHGAIISGNHRFAAYMAEFGEGHEVEVVMRKYKSAAERIEDAIRENAKHGCAMDGITRKRAILALTTLGRKPEAIATLLGISTRRVEELAGLSVIVVGSGHQPVKRGLEHMAGANVTAAQYEAHRTHDRGVPAAQAANQLVRWIENGWVDWNDHKTFESMTALHAAIGGKI